MSQNKLKEINGDANSNKQNRNGNASVENGNDLNTRKAALTPLEFRVTQQRETERPYSNKYNKHWETGTYHCVVCNAELFQSETKFESKSGWPAFYNVVDPKRVKLTADLSHIGANLLLLVAKPDLARTEVSCANCNAHLGHLFKDGPKPTGLRYCINSASLTFQSENDESIDNNMVFAPSVTNGNGSVPVPIREYECNFENMCSRFSSAATTPLSPCATTPNKEFPSKTARDNFFSSIETNNSLPPMGALCLNNQSCQRVAIQKQKPSTDDDNLKIKPQSQSRPTTLISKGAENNVNGSKIFTSSASCNITATTPTSNIVTTPISSKSKFPFSKGASLTAARINFFQKISARQDIPSPSRWAATFNAKWSSSSNKSSPLSSNNTLENHNNSSSTGSFSISSNSSNPSSRFPSSSSSGSLCTVLRQPKIEDQCNLQQPRRSASSFFSNSPSLYPCSPVLVEQVSIPPRAVAVRETTL